MEPTGDELVELAVTDRATKRDRFSMKAWCAMRSIDQRHFDALSVHDVKAMSKAAREHAAALAKREAAETACDAAAEVLIPFLDKLKAIRDAAK